MRESDILADSKRMQLELENTKTFDVPKKLVSDLRSTVHYMDMVLKRFEKCPLKVPFTSERSREENFVRSKDFPNEYYNFQCFGVRLTIWRQAGNGHAYNLATFGYMPKSKYFRYVRGYSGKYMYFNPTDDFDTAVRDWYLLCGEFMATELGIRFVNNKRSRQLRFEAFDPEENEVIIKI